MHHEDGRLGHRRLELPVNVRRLTIFTIVNFATKKSTRHAAFLGQLCRRFAFGEPGSS
jgi:hypothetical protein